MNWVEGVRPACQPQRVRAQRVAAAGMAVLRTLVALGAGLLLAAGPGHAHLRVHEAEAGIKAAYLYHFGSFIEWPDGAFETPESPLVIGVVGADELADYLEILTERRTVQGRPVRVERLRPFDPPRADVHILFYGAAAARHLARAARQLEGQPVLLVTDVRGGLAVGATIMFVIDRDRVRFDVDMETAARDGLRISARMLEVARHVARPQ
jgi:hypothetical protein